jgi:hypothetical protein
VTTVFLGELHLRKDASAIQIADEKEKRKRINSFNVSGLNAGIIYSNQSVYHLRHLKLMGRFDQGYL